MTVPPARPSFSGYFVSSNPFYLISACFMLAGCLALTNSLSWWSIPTGRLLILFATLNIYEAGLIGLAGFLILRRGHRRDGLLLLVLEVFFLVDITFLCAEISTHHSWLGPAICLLTLAVAGIKLAAILYILGVRQSAARYWFILIEIVSILAIPLIFSRSDDGSVSPRAFYLAWWLLGILPAVYELLKKCFPGDEGFRHPILTTYMVIPWLSLAAHLGILHYVYDVSFSAPMLAPATLALAMVLSRGLPESVMPRKDILTLRLLLPLGAILLSASYPPELVIHCAHPKFNITPLQIAMTMAYFELMYSFLRSYWLMTTLAYIAAVLTVLFGPKEDQAISFIARLWNRLSQWIVDLVPSTQTSWGAIFVVLAFVFLGIGAVISVRRPIPPAEPR